MRFPKKLLRNKRSPCKLINITNVFTKSIEILTGLAKNEKPFSTVIKEHKADCFQIKRLNANMSKKLCHKMSTRSMQTDAKAHL